MIKWPFRTYTHFMHYTRFENSSIILPKKKQHVTSHSDLRETLVCFSFWCCCCCLVCAHYIEQFERNTLNGEKKKCEWKYTHCVNLLIAKVIKLNGEHFIFTAKPNAHTILTYAFQVLTLVAYNILFCIKKKPFEKSAILIGTVWNVRVVVIPAKWSLWKIFLGKKITWYETKLQFSDLLA